MSSLARSWPAMGAIPPSPAPITTREFRLFQSLIHREAGIHLSEAKRALLVGRLLGRLRALGLGSFEAYYRHVVGVGGSEERVRMLDCICTNETRFFREPPQFEFLERTIIPEWKARASAVPGPRKLRVWSAACSTGEEPYSLAMVLLHHCPPSAGWQIEILGTDLSTRVLERARTAIWKSEKAKEIPPRHLKPFMLKGVGGRRGHVKAGPEIRSVVRFARLNLNDESYPVVGRFDLIFCRNVLIYFDAQSKANVIHRLLGHLAPEGYLFLGHAESLNGVTSRARAVGPTVYVHAGAVGREACGKVRGGRP